MAGVQGARGVARGEFERIYDEHWDQLEHMVHWKLPSLV